MQVLLVPCVLTDRSIQSVSGSCARMGRATFVIWYREIASTASRFIQSVLREFASVLSQNDLLSFLLVLNIDMIGAFFALNNSAVCLEGKLSGSLG